MNNKIILGAIIIVFIIATNVDRPLSLYLYWLLIILFIILGFNITKTNKDKEKIK